MLSYSSAQNNVYIIKLMLSIISCKTNKIGSNAFLTPLTKRWAKYLLSSKKRLSVCCIDNLKWLLIEITKNSKIFDAYLKLFCPTVLV